MIRVNRPAALVKRETPTLILSLMSTPVTEPTASRIISVAAALFREKGFTATSTRELSDRLGIQNSSLYHHIRSKDDLLYAISMESVKHMVETLETVVAESDYASASAAERLRRVITAHLTAAIADRDMHATMLSEMRALPPERRAEVIAARANYEQLVRAIIAEAQESGELEADPPARYLTLALLNLLNWTIFWYDPQGELQVSELAEILSNVYLRGVLASD
ncbi:MAG: Transcriptional regulator [Subtercola sp.]|jgi:AcrR family transcriptional regulator|nr:Transcriptional regulator [Subtercola sp.]